MLAALLGVAFCSSSCATATKTVETSYVDADGDGNAESTTQTVQVRYQGALPPSPSHLIDQTDQTDEQALAVAGQAVQNGTPVSVGTSTGADVNAGVVWGAQGFPVWGTGAYQANTTVGGQGAYTVAPTGAGGLPVLGQTGTTTPTGGQTSSSQTYTPGAVQCPEDPSAARTVEQELECARQSRRWLTTTLGQVAQ